MKNIREIICANLIALRKQNKFTQQDLSEKVNYSDKAISRWEKGEVLPDVETLQNLSEIYNVPLNYLFEEHSQELEPVQKQETNKLAVLCLLIIAVWLVLTVAFVYIKIFYNFIFWQAFVWAVPASCLVLIFSKNIFNDKKEFAIIRSVFLWTTLTSLYLQFLRYNLWLIYLIGIPIQVIIVIISLFKPNWRNLWK